VGAPSVSLKLIIDRVRKGIDRTALANSVLFYVPTMATTLASFALFRVFETAAGGRLNAIEVLIMAAVILSLLSASGIQFVIYKLVDENETAEGGGTPNDKVAKSLVLGVVLSAVISAVVTTISLPFLRQVINVSTVQAVPYAILTVSYSVTWILLAALWASGQQKYPAILFCLSYVAVFVLSYSLSTVDLDYILWGYVGGAGILLGSLALASWQLFRRRPRSQGFWDTVRSVPRLVLRLYWGMLFQAFFVLALFLDKIIIWISEGAKAGTGLQVVGPYTTGAFLGFIPMFSLIASAYYSERIKRSSKGMYSGTLGDIRRRIDSYKRLYWAGITSMLAAGLVILIAVVLISASVIRDPMTVTVAATVGSGVLLFQVIISNSFVLAVFNRTRVSAISMIAVCCGEGLAAFFVSSNVWYASLGFLGGCLVGLLISHFAAARLLAKFDYNAFVTFQTAS
jgi:hypothetical protein